MSHDSRKPKIKKNDFKDEDIDRLTESLLHQLYRRSPERFMVIYERLKADHDALQNSNSLTPPQHVG